MKTFQLGDKHRMQTINWLLLITVMEWIVALPPKNDDSRLSSYRNYMPKSIQLDLTNVRTNFWITLVIHHFNKLSLVTQAFLVLKGDAFKQKTFDINLKWLYSFTYVYIAIRILFVLLDQSLYFGLTNAVLILKIKNFDLIQKEFESQYIHMWMDIFTSTCRY